LHPDKQPTLSAFAAGPAFDVGIEFLPSAQVEVADAEIGALRDL
jgi:hypothetical protein